MAEDTGGHRPDTDGGPKLVAVTGGAALLESAQMLAYRAYLDHGSATCPACRAADFQCADAARLWQAYREARG